MPIEINSAGILGGGVMGSGIGQALASGGLKVTIRDVSGELSEKARGTIVDGRYGLKRGVELGKIAEADMDATLANLSFTTSLDDLKGVDLVVDAVPEDLDLKKKVWAEVDRIVQPQAVFGTNTAGRGSRRMKQA